MASLTTVDYKNLNTNTILYLYFMWVIVSTFLSHPLLFKIAAKQSSNGKH